MPTTVGFPNCPLPGHVGEEMVQSIPEEGFRLFNEEEKPYVPVEFAAGASLRTRSDAKSLYA